MHGPTLKCGSVIGISNIKNPVSLARLIMEKTPHISLFGQGAEEFAQQMKLPQVTKDYFFTIKRMEQLLNAKQKKQINLDLSENNNEENIKGTVGCVALDVYGEISVASSTGGMTNKMKGRVGDTPIIGAGLYANKLCGICCTGHGEEFMRNVIAHNIAAVMEYKPGISSIEEAANFILNNKMKKGDGGIIGIDYKGNITMIFNSEIMFRACADSKGRFEIKIEKE
jgi:beta-aspartyl-peptidase (threonine type)